MPEADGLLEVVALNADDAERAQEGGADRVHVCAWDDGEPRSVEPAEVSAIARACDIPVRVTLRLSGGFSTQGGEFTRLVGLAGDYLSLGAEGFAFGFLTRDLELDVDVCRALGEAVAPAPWTFDRAFDQVLDQRRARRQLRDLPGLDGVHTAGAALGMAAGFDDLVAAAEADPAFARLAIAAGGTAPEQLPWLVRAGVRRLHVGAAARPGGSWSKARVDTGFVRSWRLLLDAELDAFPRRAQGAG